MVEVTGNQTLRCCRHCALDRGVLRSSLHPWPSV